MAFNGRGLHEGVAISRGVRYILTGFCTYSLDGSLDPDHDDNFSGSSREQHKVFMEHYDAASDG